MTTETVAKSRDTPRLVESQPVLDPVAKPLETESRVTGVVGCALLLVQESSISLVKLLGKVPADGCKLMITLSWRS
jgi:hypothetical protein